MKKQLEDGIRNYRIKRWELALQELLSLNVQDCSPEESRELAYYLGLCFTKLERYDDALLYLEQVVTDDNGTLREYQCRQTLAYIYTITKRVRMAEFELERLTNGGFQSVQIYTMMAYAAWSQKQAEKAVILYEKALVLDDSNTTALNGLGYILVDAGLDIQRGLECCKKAVSYKPKNAAYLDSLGWAYFKSGRYPEAKTMLRQALDLAPRAKEISGHMKAVLEETA